ncbi:hypothetical protein GE061_017928 [Apolygus lucorum]|uniref:GOLD domain-containing protein n=1 Tax=Apolygus lucorum TaxID=248454 RepID=A0A8S9XCD1_APOLU|nr:hypothetical protein GE061_017928 [Apolygus lucorum]
MIVVPKSECISVRFYGRLCLQIRRFLDFLDLKYNIDYHEGTPCCIRSVGDPCPVGRDHGGKNALVVGEFNVSEVDGQQVDLLITDPRRHVLVSLKKISTGRFTFVMETDELFEMCFTSKGSVYNRDAAHSVELSLKRGVEARKDDELAIAEKLKPLETDIVYAEKLAESIVEEFVTMKARERALTDTNESTLDRVLYLGIFNVLWLIVAVASQLKYLHNYFKSKKLVE